MKHLSSYYSEDNNLIAEVYRYDEQTYTVLFQEGKGEVTRSYYSTLQQAENAAEDFVD